LQPEDARSMTTIGFTAGVAYLKARKDDPWTKVVEHNTRLHHLELKDQAIRKKQEQERVRKMLQDQLDMKAKQNNDQARQDMLYVQELQNKHKRDSEAEKQQEFAKKMKMQEINRQL
jgi:hypothetical protein